MAEDGRKNPLGPIGQRAAQNVMQRRKALNLTYAELSRRLEGLGRPIPTLGLSRIEQQQRRIDVDDLVALGLALEVSPNMLLLEMTYVDGRHGLDITDEIALTERRSMLVFDALEWLYDGKGSPAPAAEKQRIRALVEQLVDERLTAREGASEHGR